jgi:transcriptional regulator with XRE-family HTH domain
MSTGTLLKELRKKHGWTQAELGEKIGMTYSGIASIENDKADPSKATTLKLSEIFNVSTDYLLTGKEEPTGISQDEKEVIEIMRKDSDFSEAVKKAAGLKKKVINYLESYKPSKHQAA